MQNIILEEHVSVDPEICHGKPCIKGTRVLVETLFANLKEGMSPDEILGHYPSIPYESIHALANYVRDEITEAAPEETLALEPTFQ